MTQFLTWALTIGRLLIILTETLALGTFLYRFGLDMKIVDLHDQIKANSFIVKNFQPQEIIFRNLQARLALAKKADSLSSKLPTIFQDIIQMGRGKVTFLSILVANETVKLQVQASSVNDLSSFVSSLKTYTPIKSLSIDSVQDKTSQAVIIISLTGTMKTDTVIQPTPTSTAQQLQQNVQP